MPDYVYQPYPAWRYHKTLPAKIVENEAEDTALGKGWVDSPAKLLDGPVDNTPLAGESEGEGSAVNEPPDLDSPPRRRKA